MQSNRHELWMHDGRVGARLPCWLGASEGLLPLLRLSGFHRWGATSAPGVGWHTTRPYGVQLNGLPVHQ